MESVATRSLCLGYTRLSADVWTRDAQISKTLPAGQAAFGLSITENVSDSELVQHRAATLTTRYAHGEAVWHDQPSVTPALTRARYSDNSPVFGVLPEDTELRPGLGIAPPEINALGFIPTVELTAKRNRSNVPACESQGLGLRVGDRSSS